MKILMVSEDLPGHQLGGLGKHVVTLANALLAHGHDVVLLGRKEGDPAHCGFRGRFISAIALAHPNWKESQLGCFNPIKRPWFARHLAALIHQHAPGFDIIHYHGHLPLVGAYIDPAVPFVQTRHDQGSDCLIHLRFREGQVCNAIDARTCASCIGSQPGLVRQALSATAVEGYRDRTAMAFGRHKTIFVSDFLRRRFARARPSADLCRTRVIPNVIDMARLRRHARTPSEPGHIVLAGRIDAGKGFEEFLARAHGTMFGKFRITIVGDGPLLAGLAQRYARADTVFTGWRDYDGTIALTASAQVCVVPSVCEEACSTTVLEALALGRPCLALARGGTPELLRYQRYPGQLQLAPDMPALVDTMAHMLARATPAITVSEPFGADVHQVLPQLLDYYAR
jgi:glycosyltransferase involved in cell wall biosynthesis